MAGDDKDVSSRRSPSIASSDPRSLRELSSSPELDPPEYHGNGNQRPEKQTGAREVTPESSAPPPPVYEEAPVSSDVGSSAQHAQSPVPVRSPNVRIAIPQISSVKGAPFMRAYAPELSDLGISEQEFIFAIDTINSHAMGNAAFSALDLTGNFVHQIPLPVISGLGYYLSTASKYGNAASSKSGLQTCIENFNERMLGPKGLKASMCDGKMLKRVLGLPERTPMLPPLDTGVPLDRQPSILQRRINGLKGRASAIEATSLPMQSVGTMTKLASKRADKDMDAEEKELTRSRKQTLKYRQAGRLDDQDKEERIVGKLLWLIVEQV